MITNFCERCERACLDNETFCSACLEEINDTSRELEDDIDVTQIEEEEQ